MRRTYLQSERRSKLLTQRELAKIIGVSKSSISMIENGSMEPSWQVAQKLEEFFKITASELLKKDDK